MNTSNKRKWIRISLSIAALCVCIFTARAIYLSSPEVQLRDQLNAELTQGAVQETQIALTPTDTPVPTPTTVDLQAALQQQTVSITFTATGAASGATVHITLQRLSTTGNDMIVTFSPALMLTTSDQYQQDLVLLRPTQMQIGSQESSTEDTGIAFCANFHRGNPLKGANMTLSGQASHDLVALMKTELSRSDSVLVIQAAVWAITDNPTRDDLNAVGYQLSDQDIPAVRQLLQSAGLNSANYQLTT